LCALCRIIVPGQRGCAIMLISRDMSIAIIAAHCGAGAGDPRTREGPVVLREAGLEGWLRELGFATKWYDVGVTNGAAPIADNERLQHVVDAAASVARCVESVVGRGERFLVIGGDHSVAVGTWSGLANALGPGRDTGLLWLDAHLDSHVPETTPSGNLHGMAIAHLLGHGVRDLRRLARLAPAQSARRLVVAGVRSFEPEEPVLLAREGVRTLTMADLQGRTYGAVADEILLAIGGRSGFGISIDLDVMDPTVSPGVGSQVAGGLEGREAVDLIGLVCRRPGLIGLEIVEFNPYRDRNGATVAMVRRLIEAALGAAQ
jgi:arginase